MYGNDNRFVVEVQAAVMHVHCRYECHCIAQCKDPTTENWHTCI